MPRAYKTIIAFMGKKQLQKYKSNNDWIPMIAYNEHNICAGWSDEFMSVKNLTDKFEKVDMGLLRFALNNGSSKFEATDHTKYTPGSLNTSNYRWEWSKGLELCLCWNVSQSPEMVQKAKDYLEAGNRVSGQL